jgi:roadblock/LC7 domain-containing protein
MADAKTITISADKAVVSISGYLANTSGTKNIVAQTSGGTRILGSFVAAGFTDANGNNFAKTVMLGPGTYTIGATGAPGNVFVTDDAGAVEPITNISVTIAR